MNQSNSASTLTRVKRGGFALNERDILEETVRVKIENGNSNLTIDEEQVARSLGLI
jgi:hypothetical protein